MIEYDIQLRYLARIYCDQPQTLADADFLSGVSRALEVDRLTISPGVDLTPTGVVNRMLFVSPSGEWMVSILGESVDIAHRGSLDQPVTPFENFCRLASSAAAVVVGQSRETQPHRLALLSEGFLPQTKIEDFDRMAGQLLRLPRLFRPAPWEWDWRAVTTVRRDFGSVSEDTNTLVTAKRISGTFKPNHEPFDRIRMDFDINTSPADTQPRFETDDVADFFRRGASWHSELRSEMGAFLAESV